jgi:transglutaminase-like putative cysteine protease
VIRYRLVHETRYRYGAPVTLGHHQARLIPLDCATQRCRSWRIHIEPAPAVYREQHDYQGNRVAYFSVEQAHEALAVTAVSEVEVSGPAPGLAPVPDLPWERGRDRIREIAGGEQVAVHDYALDSALVVVEPGVAEYAAPSFSPGGGLLESVGDLMARIHREFTYDPAFSTISTPLREVLVHRRGVCQDFAHLAIACIRSRGLAARYVSGYLETDPPPGGERLTGADASHAWFSVYVPGSGWVDFDPTNNQVPLDRHITLARGRDFADVTPLKGVLYGGGAHTLSVAVTVERVVAAEVGAPGEAVS